MIHHISRATRHLIFWFLVASAMGMTGVRLALTLLDNYKAELERQVGSVVAAPVHIGSLKATMHGFIPSLVLKNIEVASTNGAAQAAVKLDEIRLRIDLRDVLFKQALWVSSKMTLVGVELTVIRLKNGGFTVLGLSPGAETDNLPWLLQSGRFELLHSRISWIDETGDDAPLIFENVNLAVINDGDEHRVHMLLKPPADHGDALRISMVLHDDFLKAGGLDGRVYFEGSGIRLPHAAKGYFPGLSFGSGLGHFKVWSDWRHSELVGASGDLDFRDLSVRDARQAVFAAERLSGRFNFRHDGDATQLDIDDLIVGGAGTSGAGSKFSVRFALGSEGELQRVALAVKRLDLKDVARLAQMPGLLPAAVLENLSGLKPSGRLQDLTLYADVAAQQFALDGRFEAVGFEAFDKMPGITGLSGRLHGNERRGQLLLDSKALRLDSQGLFRQILETERVNGMLSWQRMPDAWTVASEHLKLDLPGVKTRSRFALTLPKDATSPYLDLYGDFALADATLAPRYLPAAVMGVDTVAWLDKAFLKGSVPKGRLQFEGRLADFPYIDGSGVFEVLFDTEHMTLAFHPEWPPLTELDARVRFRGESLAVNVRHAQAMQCNVQRAEVTIPSFESGDYVYVRNAEAAGSIPDLLAVLRQSPLKGAIDRILAVITPEGDSTVKFDLDAPMLERLPIKVQGAASLNDGRLTVGSNKLPVDNINGALEFDDQGVRAQRLDAVALGHPIRATLENQPERALLKVSGKADLNAVQQRFELPDWTFAEGAAEYELTLYLPNDAKRSAEMSIVSALQGVALDLPEGLAKSREQQRRLALRFDFGNERFLPIELNYDNTLKAGLKVDRTRRTVSSGHILYGSGMPSYPGPGVKLEADSDTLRLETWLGWTGGLQQGMALPIQQVEIHTGHLLNETRDLGAFELSMQPDPKGWNGRIAGAGVQGGFFMPKELSGTEKIRLRMASIDLSELGKIELSLKTSADAKLPLFDIDSDKTWWRSFDLGRLSLVTERVTDGIAFRHVELSGPQQQLHMTGAWTVAKGRVSTRLQGYFESERFGRLLEDLGLYDHMKETYAYTDFSLNWSDAPYRFALDALNGSVDVKLKNGRLSKIEPGIGRALGLLAF
ncbi:MAG: YhdP family protein, partial [Gammaproteobacteria bacterium]